MRRGLVAIVAAAALLGSSARAVEAVSTTASSKIPQFKRRSTMEAVHAANPHDASGKPLCQRCHISGKPGAAVDSIALCSQCHDASRMKHPVGMAARSVPRDLPLGEGGVIACHTCHDPHDVKRNPAGLRLSFAELCRRCHDRHGAHAPAR